MTRERSQAQRALEVERLDMPDGSILFRFKVQKVSVEEEEKITREVERRLGDDETPSENVVARWIMTVKFLASTLSLENALVYIAMTPLRMAFWTLAYTVRAMFWIVTGRGGNVRTRRAKQQLKQSTSVVATGPTRGFNPFGSVKKRPNWRS